MISIFCITGPLKRGVDSRSSPQAPHAPSLPRKYRIPGESFTSQSAPLRVTLSLHCSIIIGVISCALFQWLYPCAMCRYCAFKSMTSSLMLLTASRQAMCKLKLCSQSRMVVNSSYIKAIEATTWVLSYVRNDPVVIFHVNSSYTACMYQVSQKAP